jgi:hypothetical protein
MLGWFSDKNGELSPRKVVIAMSCETSKGSTCEGVSFEDTPRLKDKQRIFDLI